jgi:hypothetical protein
MKNDAITKLDRAVKGLPRMGIPDMANYCRTLVLAIRNGDAIKLTFPLPVHLFKQVFEMENWAWSSSYIRPMDEIEIFVECFVVPRPDGTMPYHPDEQGQDAPFTPYTKEEAPQGAIFKRIRLELNGTYWATQKSDGLIFIVGDPYKMSMSQINIPFDAIPAYSDPGVAELLKDVCVAFIERNAERGYLPPYKVPPPAKSVPKEEVAHIPSYDLRVSQEAKAIMSAFADGRSNQNYQDYPDSNIRSHRRSQHHRVDIQLQEGDGIVGDPLTFLKALTDRLDFNSALGFIYVLGQVAPPDRAPGDNRSVLIHLEYVAQAINPNYATMPSADRAALRSRAWDLILFGARAKVVGDRNITYRRPITREVIPTNIDAPPLMLGLRASPSTLALFPEDPPEVVEVAISKAWLPLMTDPDIRQYMPLGEVLAAIPGGRLSGAWARSIGFRIAELFRWKSTEVLQGKALITRRTLLTDYTPATGDAIELLSGPHATRGVGAYASALDILVSSGLLASFGEAAPGIAKKRLDESGVPLKNKGWLQPWLDTHIILKPGVKWVHEVEDRSANRPIVPPKKLPRPLGKKRSS